MQCSACAGSVGVYGLPWVGGAVGVEGAAVHSRATGGDVVVLWEESVGAICKY